MSDQLFSIQKACKILNVSISSLHRWDETGALVAIRTPGGHRRYKLSDIEKLMKVEPTTLPDPEPNLDIKLLSEKFTEDLNRLVDKFNKDVRKAEKKV